MKSSTNQRPCGRFPAVGPRTVNGATDPLRLRSVILTAVVGVQLARKQPPFTSNCPATHRPLLYADTARHRTLYTNSNLLIYISS